MGVSKVFHQLPQLMSAHNIQPEGVLHVGGHRGQEAAAYERCGFQTVTWVEPNPALTPPGDVLRVAVGTQPGRRPFYLLEDTQGSSLLPHVEHPMEEMEVDVVRLDDITTPANVLVLDVQGSELDVLQSGDLTRFDLVVVETRDRHRYEGQATPKQVDRHMTKSGFKKVAVYTHKQRWVADRVYVHA